MGNERQGADLPSQGEKSKNVKSGEEIARLPQRSKDTTNKEHNVEKEKDERKKTRIKIIHRSINYCFVGLLVYILILIADLVLFTGDVYNSPPLVVFVSIISGVLTTLIGAVIGSSID